MPVIPPEGAYTESELRFIESQPPGLWPENQDSNFGQLRKVLTDILQERRDEIDMIAAERFPQTADNYLALWEEMLGAAVDPSGKTIAQRRAVIESRLKYGAFTRPLVRIIVESFLGTTTGGTPAAFGPSGIPILGGIPLYGAASAVSQLYRIYENPTNYSYEVWIDSANVPDINALTRELSRVTPAGISFTIDTTHTGTGLINWGKTVTGLAPSGWWRLGTDYNDYSGIGSNGVVTGAPAAIASPGLIGAAGSDAARDFSGSSQYVTIPAHSARTTMARTWFARVRPDALPTVGNYYFVYGAAEGVYSSFMGIANYDGTTPIWSFRSTGVNSGDYREISVYTGLVPGAPAINPVIGTTYSLGYTFDGETMQAFVNGIKFNSVSDLSFEPAPPGVGGNMIGTYPWGGSGYFNGGLDEVLHLGYVLSDAEMMYLHRQATNQL